MFERLLAFFKEKLSQNNGSNETPAGFISYTTDVRSFVLQHKIKDCRARTLSQLIAWLETLPGQKWYVTRVSEKKAGIRTVGIYEEFPDLEIASSWLTEYGGGKYYVKPLSPGKIKIGYYEFEGDGKEPEDLKDELNRKIEELKDELHKKDMQLMEEKFKKSENSGGWDAFTRFLESDTGRELGKEALETIKEIFKITRSKGKEEEEIFEEYISKVLPSAKEDIKK